MGISSISKFAQFLDLISRVEEDALLHWLISKRSEPIKIVVPSSVPVGNPVPVYQLPTSTPRKVNIQLAIGQLWPESSWWIVCTPRKVEIQLEIDYIWSLDGW